MDTEPKALQSGRYLSNFKVRILDGIMSNLRNKCEGHGLINRPPMSPYLHDCWWRNKPPTTIQEAKPKQEDVSSEAEASPPPAKSDNILFTLVCAL